MSHQWPPNLEVPVTPRQTCRYVSYIDCGWKTWFEGKIGKADGSGPWELCGPGEWFTIGCSLIILLNQAQSQQPSSISTIIHLQDDPFKYNNDLTFLYYMDCVRAFYMYVVYSSWWMLVEAETSMINIILHLSNHHWAIHGQVTMTCVCWFRFLATTRNCIYWRTLLESPTLYKTNTCI